MQGSPGCPRQDRGGRSSNGSVRRAQRPAHLPTCRPPKIKEMARLRWSVGMARATTSVAAEGATPSPSPTAARDRKRPGSVPASRGTPAVAAAGAEGTAADGQRCRKVRQASCRMQAGRQAGKNVGSAAVRCSARALLHSLPVLTAPQRDARRQHGAAAQHGGGVAARDLAQKVAPEEGRLHQACGTHSGTDEQRGSGWALPRGCAPGNPPKQGTKSQRSCSYHEPAAWGGRRAGRWRAAMMGATLALRPTCHGGAPPKVLGHGDDRHGDVDLPDLEGLASSRGWTLCGGALMQLARHRSSEWSSPCLRSILRPPGATTQHPPCPCCR